MPIAELGYRHWQGKRTSALRRSLAIARSEVAIAYKNSKLLRRFLIFAWMPILYFCPFFLAIGYVADPSNDLGEGAMLTEMASEFLPREAVEKVRENPELFLPQIWAIAFYFFFAYTQSIFVPTGMNAGMPTLKLAMPLPGKLPDVAMGPIRKATEGLMLRKQLAPKGIAARPKPMAMKPGAPPRPLIRRKFSEPPAASLPVTMISGAMPQRPAQAWP